MSTSTVKSVCPYCGVGCGIVLHVQDGRVAKVSGDKAHPANKGRLCTKGQSCHVPLEQGRLSNAFLRPTRGEEQRPVPMREAITETARRLTKIIEAHGPDAVSFYISGQMSLEAQYLANKLAKGFVRTRHIEANSRLCMASAATGYKLSLGADAPPGSYDDLDHASTFLVIGANMADCHPVLFLRLLDRVKQGAKLIVVDPRRSATADKADLFLQIKPGTDIALLNGILHLLHAAGKTDAAFIAAHTEGFEALPDFLEDFSPARVAGITGLAEADIRRAAEWIGREQKFVSLWTMGLNQSTAGTWNTNTLCNLHLALGAICRQGAGPFSLTGQPNAMGGREMGYMGSGLPGQRDMLNAADRAFTEDIWNLPPGTLRAEKNLGAVNMFDEMAAGRIKACWIICTNPVASMPARGRTMAGLNAAELVIVQDAYLTTETTPYADILLPGAFWAEADGVMVNSERNMSLARQAVSPPGEAMADWRIIAEMAMAMGFSGFAYESAAEIFDEIRRFSNPATGYDLSGASHARLGETPLQWPVAAGGGPRNPIRYIESGVPFFPTQSGKAVFYPRPCLPPAELPDDEYNFVLNTGRVQHQWHTLTKTGKVTTLNKLNPGPFVEINPQDAADLALATGDSLALRSRRGRAVLPARVSDRVQPGCVFAPFHWNDVFGDELAVNEITSPAVDALSLQPEYKFAAVALARVAALPMVATPAPPALASRGGASAALVTILYASQTGTAERAAKDAAHRFGGIARAMDEAIPTTLSGIVLFFAASFGDGEPPDNGIAFWRALAAEDAPRLELLKFGVLAFGDSAYAQFCGFGASLESRLVALGAQPLLARQNVEPGEDAPVQDWLARAGAVLGKADAMPLAKPRLRLSLSPLKSRERLNGAGSEKETRHIVFGLEGSGFTYQPGDALSVRPQNDPAVLAQMARLTGLDAEELAGRDLTRLTPPLLEFCTARTPALAALRDSGTWGRQLPDLLADFTIQASAKEWRAVLKPLTPRLYSISSSQNVHPGEVHLTVNIVRFGQGGGLCSRFLADRAEAAEIFIQPSAHFRLPADDATPVIMIGPGTGIAPFRGFLQERQARGAKGRNWLLFGEQRAACDFYYRDELEGFAQAGYLHRLSTAFSRDQAQKIYVQDRLREHGAELWAWLQEGAHVYVCGDAARMAKDVDAALRGVARAHGGVDGDEYVEVMAVQKRYLRDVY